MDEGSKSRVTGCLESDSRTAAHAPMKTTFPLPGGPAPNWAQRRHDLLHQEAMLRDFCQVFSEGLGASSSGVGCQDYGSFKLWVANSASAVIGVTIRMRFRVRVF